MENIVHMLIIIVGRYVRKISINRIRKSGRKMRSN